MKHAILVAAVLVLAAFPSAAQTSEPATLILVNGRIFTGDPANLFVDAVAIAGNKIIAVGTTEEIRRLADVRTRIVNLDRRTAIPGINDAHLHPGVAPGFRIDLGPDPSLENIRTAVAGAAEESPQDLIISAMVGPAIINNPNITRRTLDNMAVNRRIILTSFTGHGMILSSAAMTLLGVADNAPDPEGGWFGRDAEGKVNGRAFEYAQYPLERKFFDLATDEEIAQALETFEQDLLRFGITSIQAMPLLSEERFINAYNTARIPVRLRVMDVPMSKADSVTPGTKGVKWILDGTPIERGAALRNSRYSDGSQGKLNFTDIRPLLKIAVNAGGQALLHASGDATVSQVLTTLRGITPALVRPRIEHGDGLQKDQFSLAKGVGVVVVLNPTHFPFRNAYPTNEAYMPAKSLLTAGIPIALGSDGPLNPYLGIMEAVDRAEDSEELTRQQAVIAYTNGSAFAESLERQKGRISVGMLADIAVLSQDIFEVPLASLPDTHSVMTIINGRIEHSEL